MKISICSCFLFSLCSVVSGCLQWSPQSCHACFTVRFPFVTCFSRLKASEFDLGPFELIPSGWLYFWLCGWSGKLSSHTLNQSDAKLKPITTWSPAFSRALGYLLIFPWSSTWLYKVFPFLLIGHLRIPEEDFLVYTNGISLKKGCWHYFLTWCGFLNSFFSRFVQVIVSGINPIDLVISAPQLIITNCSSVKVTPLHSSVEYVSVSITAHSPYLHFLFLAIYLWFSIF